MVAWIMLAKNESRRLISRAHICSR